ncbi:ABC transporter ATP-binding protein [Candidatus Uabimicrobium amorphum]|uniref:Multidrug ABC transporter ATP-binding protein n=1 Tax=Uabimicrobium amorphum TaxID=2596890 RepID=A0A5S9F2B2_UABAM|nr:ABC transporter ATP-binding protein [Candidatus Uabimicrobium amorphum]BBM83282.1 multidrug ABC transporter ATP-binding protein [Candidatus Uabimicrobium amorphum]
MSEVISIQNLCKKFGKNQVLDNVNLNISSGVVYALVGKNGVGKTTLLRTLLGLSHPTSGQSTVFGLDSQRDDWKIRQQVGYVADGLQMYEWMTVKEILWFVSRFYPTWDSNYEKELAEKFTLNYKAKIKTLSRGFKSKLLLTMAMAHRPKLLILDEATAGLDVAVRREFLDCVVDTVEKEDHTVVISSHLLQDVERIADQIGFLQNGKIHKTYSVEELKNTFRKIQVSFDVLPESIDLEGVLHQQQLGREYMLTVRDYSSTHEQQLRDMGAKEVRAVHMSLEDVFVECLTEEATI